MGINMENTDEIVAEVLGLRKEFNEVLVDPVTHPGGEAVDAIGTEAGDGGTENLPVILREDQVADILL